jgi:hypothetical protein
VRRRTAIVVVAVLTPLALILGASVTKLTAQPARTGAARLAPTPAPTSSLVPAAHLGICASDAENLFAAIAPLPGEVAARVVAELPPDYAAAFDSFARAGALPAQPDTPTLAHVLARLSGSDRRAVLTAIPAERQAVINAALLDTALMYMTYAVRPACP